MMLMVPGIWGSMVSNLPPTGVNSMTTVMPAARACLTGVAMAVPSLAWMITTLNRLEVTASCSWLTCVGPSKLESRNSVEALCALAYSWTPAHAAWANELAFAKPKNPMLSFLDSSTEVAAELAAGELATALVIALVIAPELPGAELAGAELDGAALEAGLTAAELVEELELEPAVVDDELQAARVSARAAVPAARSFVVRFTLVTP